jgi:hypothetical protein
MWTNSIATCDGDLETRKRKHDPEATRSQPAGVVDEIVQQFEALRAQVDRPVVPLRATTL